MIANKVDDFLWITAEHPLLQFFCHKSANGYQFIVAEYRLRYSKGDNRCVYKREIYSTEIFTLEPAKMLREILNNVGNCRDVFFPIEAAYKYGGLIQGEPITMAPIDPELVH
jgi:hypothetical protein